MTQVTEFPPELEDEFWPLYDAVQEAQVSGDTSAILETTIAFLDWQLANGLLTTNDIRAYLLETDEHGVPHVNVLMQRLIELDPELADGQASIAVDWMDGRHGVSEAGWAAIMLNAYTWAREELGLDRRLTPEFRDSLVRKARSIETRADLACQLLHRHAHKRFSPAQGDHAEAWSTSKGARREAQDILELLDAPVERREGWYLQRSLPQGDGE